MPRIRLPLSGKARGILTLAVPKWLKSSVERLSEKPRRCVKRGLSGHRSGTIQPVLASVDRLNHARSVARTFFRQFPNGILRSSHAALARVTSSPLWCRKEGRVIDGKSRRGGGDLAMISPGGTGLAPGSGGDPRRPGGPGARALGVGRRDEDPRPRVAWIGPFHGGLHLRLLRHPQRAPRHPRPLPRGRPGSKRHRLHRRWARSSFAGRSSRG